MNFESDFDLDLISDFDDAFDFEFERGACGASRWPGLRTRVPVPLPLDRSRPCPLQDL